MWAQRQSPLPTVTIRYDVAMKVVWHTFYCCCLHFDLQISDKSLIDLIRRKVKLNQPYAGVFLRRDDEYDCYYPLWMCMFKNIK